MKYSLTTLCGSHRVVLPEGRSFMGSDPRNAIAVRPETGASAKQFEIWEEPDGCWLRDCYSGVPTYVNGQTISVMKLEPGDIIQVGSLQMRFEQEGVVTPSKPVSRRITGSIPISNPPRTSSVAVKLPNPAVDSQTPQTKSLDYSNLSARTTRSVPTMRTAKGDSSKTYLPRKTSAQKPEPVIPPSLTEPGATQGAPLPNAATPPIMPALPDGTASALMRQTFVNPPAAPISSSLPVVPEFGPPNQDSSLSVTSHDVPSAPDSITQFPNLGQSEFGPPGQTNLASGPDNSIRTSTITRINHPGRDWEKLSRRKPKFGRWLMASAAMFCLGGPIVAHFQSNGRSTEAIRRYLPDFLKPKEFAPATIEATESHLSDQVITAQANSAVTEMSDLLDPEHFSLMDDFTPASLSSIISVRGEELYSAYQSLQRGADITAWLARFTPALNYNAADVVHFTVLNSADRSFQPTVIISLKNKTTVDQILGSGAAYQKQPITHQKYRGFKITDASNQTSIIIERGPRTYLQCDERSLQSSNNLPSVALVKQYHPFLFKREFTIAQIGAFPFAELAGSSIKGVSIKLGTPCSVGLMLPSGPGGLSSDKTDNGTQSTYDNWRRQSVFNFSNIIREGVPGFYGLRGQTSDKNSVIRYLDKHWIHISHSDKSN